jgi:hypothetical protein
MAGPFLANGSAAGFDEAASYLAFSAFSWAAFLYEV